MNNPYETEKDFVDKLEKFLIECGFKTWREVVPDIHIDSILPFRVDLIFFKQGVGYTAVEAKNFRSLRQGGAFAKAIEQINKYKDLTFFKGMKIKRWCVSTPMTIPTISSKDIELRVISEVSNFIKHFINYMFDISLLEFIEYPNHQWDRIAIDGNVKERSVHINKSTIKGGGLKDGDSIPKL